MTDTDKSGKSDVELYEAGKARRYQLLFTVNAGAFAIVTFWANLKNEAGSGDPDPLAGINPSTELIGALQAGHVGVGMAAYCALMGYDIYKFGKRFEGSAAKGGETPPQGGSPGLFGPVGKFVLFGTTGLMILAWLLASGLLAGCLRFASPV